MHIPFHNLQGKLPYGLLLKKKRKKRINKKAKANVGHNPKCEQPVFKITDRFVN